MANTKISPNDYNDIINWSVLGEIISIDEDNPEFVQNLVSTFVNQVLATFEKIDVILEQITPNGIDYKQYSNKIKNTKRIHVPSEFCDDDFSGGGDDDKLNDFEMIDDEIIDSNNELINDNNDNAHNKQDLIDTNNSYYSDFSSSQPDSIDFINNPGLKGSNFSKQVQHELNLNKQKNLSKIKNPKNIKIQLSAVSEFGHYIKGSASSLGFHTLQKYCERIQNYGNLLNHDNFVLTPENDEFFKIIDLKYDNYLTKLCAKNYADLKDSNNIDEELWVFYVKNSLDNAKVEFNKLRDFFRSYFDDEKF